MKNLKLKSILAVIAMLIILFANITVMAASEGMQIVKKAEKEYLIYVENNLDNAFEFALSNDKNANKEDLVFYKSAKDKEDESAYNIAYVDEKLYDKYLSTDTYIWVRKDSDNYLIEAEELDLDSAITDDDIETVNNITKNISVDTTQSYEKPEETVDGVKVTKTVGKIIVKDEGENAYQLIKVEETGDPAELAKIVEEVVNGKIEDNYYSKLEVAGKLSVLYNKLVPDADDPNWIEVSDNEILQPEEAKEDDKYIVWIKNENGEDVKTDVQFLTCFEDYKPEVISEKVVSKLPVTSDDPTLFIILGVLVTLLIVALVARIVINKRNKN